MPFLKLPILDLKVVGFSHWLLKNSVFSVDSYITKTLRDLYQYPIGKF